MAASAEDLGAPGRDTAYGFGLVQADGALALLASGCAAGGVDDGGGDDGGGTSCDLGLPGDVCQTNADCCSGSCKNAKGVKTCR
jgi:hypothetical protein